MQSRKWQISGTPQCRLSSLLTDCFTSRHRHRVVTRLASPDAMYSIRIIVRAQLPLLLEESVEERSTEAQSCKWEVKVNCASGLRGVLRGKICAVLFRRLQSRLFLSFQATFPPATDEAVYSVLAVEGRRSLDE